MRYLFLKGTAEWKIFFDDDFTAPQIAFVVTLLHHICSNIKGSFTASLYRPKYENYLARFKWRIEAGKLDLKKFREIVLSEAPKEESNLFKRGNTMALVIANFPVRDSMFLDTTPQGVQCSVAKH